MHDLTFSDLEVNKCYVVFCEPGTSCIGVSLFDQYDPKNFITVDIIRDGESFLVLDEPTDDPNTLLVLGPRKKGLIQRGTALNPGHRYCYRKLG